MSMYGTQKLNCNFVCHSQSRYFAKMDWNWSCETGGCPLKVKNMGGGEHDQHMEKLSYAAGGHSLQWSLKAWTTVLVHIFNNILFLSQRFLACLI